MLPDEWYYLENGLRGTLTGRTFVDLYMTIIFQFFRVGSLTAFQYFFPIHTALWGFSTIYLVRKLLSLADVPNRISAFILLSSFMLPVFSIFSVGFLTESMALTTVLFGTYMTLSYLKNRRTYLILLASLGFTASATIREPYQIFIFGTLILFVIIVLRTGRRWLDLLIFALPLLLFAKIPLDAQLSILYPSAYDLIINYLFPPQMIQPEKIIYVNVSLSFSPETVTSSGETPTLSGSVLLDIMKMIPRPLGVFALGLGIGWSPFLLAAAGLALLLNLKALLKSHSLSDLTILWVSLLAFGSYFGVSTWASNHPFYYTPAAFSTLMRFSHSTIPAYFLMIPRLVVKLSRRILLILIVVLVSLTVVLIPVYAVFSQIHLSSGYVNRLSFQYRAPYVEMIEHMKSEYDGRDVYAYAAVSGPSALYLRSLNFVKRMTTPEADFVKLRLPYAYLLVGKESGLQIDPAKVGAFIQELSDPYVKQKPKTYPFAIGQIKVLFDNPESVLFKVELIWDNASKK